MMTIFIVIWACICVSYFIYKYFYISKEDLYRYERAEINKKKDVFVEQIRELYEKYKSNEIDFHHFMEILIFHLKTNTSIVPNDIIRDFSCWTDDWMPEPFLDKKIAELIATMAWCQDKE